MGLCSPEDLASDAAVRSDIAFTGVGPRVGRIMEDPAPDEGFMDNFVGWSLPDLGGAMVFFMWASVVLEGSLNSGPASTGLLVLGFLTAELDSLLPTLKPVFFGVNWRVFTAEAEGFSSGASAELGLLGASVTEDVDETEDLLDPEAGAKLLLEEIKGWRDFKACFFISVAGSLGFKL